MAEPEDGLTGAYGALLFVAALGLISLGAALFVESSEVLFAVLIALGTTLLGTSAVIVVDRMIPPASQRKVTFQRHTQIYDEFERMLNSLPKDRPHIIRTVNSFPPRSDTGDHWDARVHQYLESNRQTQFIRVIFSQETPEWTKRLAVIKEHYAGLPNYIQYRAVAPPAMEMFLVDKDQVLISFGTPAGTSAPITYGVKLEDPRLCEQLEAYHRIRLEGQMMKEAL